MGLRGKNVYLERIIDDSVGHPFWNSLKSWIETGMNTLLVCSSQIEKEKPKELSSRIHLGFNILVHDWATKMATLTSDLLGNFQTSLEDFDETLHLLHSLCIFGLIYQID